MLSKSHFRTKTFVFKQTASTITAKLVEMSEKQHEKDSSKFSYSKAPENMLPSLGQTVHFFFVSSMGKEQSLGMNSVPKLKGSQDIEYAK